MNEADRIVGARDAQSRADAARREQAQATAHAQAANELAAELHARPRDAMSKLERRGFPGGTVVSVQVKSWFRTKTVQRAGWPVHTYKYTANPNGSAECERETTVWLLSTGTLAIGSAGGAIPFNSEWFVRNERSVARTVSYKLQHFEA
jgi:hypothetical protein